MFTPTFYTLVRRFPRWHQITPQEQAQAPDLTIYNEHLGLPDPRASDQPT